MTKVLPQYGKQKQLVPHCLDISKYTVKIFDSVCINKLEINIEQNYNGNILGIVTQAIDWLLSASTWVHQLSNLF